MLRRWRTRNWWRPPSRGVGGQWTRKGQSIHRQRQLIALTPNGTTATPDSHYWADTSGGDHIPHPASHEARGHMGPCPNTIYSARKDYSRRGPTPGLSGLNR